MSQSKIRASDPALLCYLQSLQLGANQILRRLTYSMILFRRAVGVRQTLNAYWQSSHHPHGRTIQWSMIMKRILVAMLLFVPIVFAQEAPKAKSSQEAPKAKSSQEAPKAKSSQEAPKAKSSQEAPK